MLMMAGSAEALVTGLRAWTKDHDPHVRAAVQLLIWHGFWLRRADFTRACVRRGSVTWIDWDKARRFVDQGAVASTSEMAVLDLAVALGENRYRLSIMGTAHSRAIADAVSRAVGIEPGQAPPVLDGLQRLSIADARHSVQRLDSPGAEPPSRHALETGVRNLLMIIDHLTGATHG
jgi:hypothetical protein